MSSRLAICHARAVMADRVVPDATIVIEDGKIADVQAGATPGEVGAAATFDADGRVVGPGFIDPHCHGDGEIFLFNDPNAAVRTLLRHGTTGVVPTLGYPDMQRDALGPQLRRWEASLDATARRIIVGVHLEGPYTNRKYGARTSRGVIKDPDPAEYESLLRDFPSLIRWWTCAPELPGAEDFIAAAAAAGVVVAAGHTEASVEQMSVAIDRGLRVITHWSNATGNIQAAAFAGTRRPGIDEFTLVRDELIAEIIPDAAGRHVHPLMSQLLFRAKGADRILVITDAGYRKPGDQDHSGLDVCIDREGNLAGSRLSMNRSACNFQAATGCTLPELFRMTSLNAARLLRIDQSVGSIAAGKTANLVVLNHDWTVAQTFLHGEPML